MRALIKTKDMQIFYYKQSNTFLINKENLIKIMIFKMLSKQLQVKILQLIHTSKRKI